jgi:hypothetical protein
VKFIRLSLTLLATVIVLAVLVVAAAFAPPVQTWFARMELLDQPGVQGSLGSLSAGFGRVEVEDVKLQSEGVSLTLPALEARLPLVKAWRGRVLVRSIVAKGWTLDLSRLGDNEPEIPVPDAAGSQDSAPPPAASPATQAAAVFGGILSGHRLPFDAALDGVDLEGDVILTVAPGRPPARVHVTVTGGGMAAGREGAFEIDASRVPAESDASGDSASAHVRLGATMDTARTLGRVEVRADIRAVAAGRPEEITLDAAASRARGTDDETYSLEMIRGDRHLASVAASFPASSRRLSGTWTMDLRDADLAPFLPERPLPSLAVSGSGQFDTDGSFARLHVAGRAAADADRLGVLSPVLGRLGSLRLGSRFDVVRTGRIDRFEVLEVSVLGDRPGVAARALQAFEFDEESGTAKPADAGRDVAEISVRRLPLSRLPALPAGLAFSGGEATGEFTLRTAEGGYAVRSRGPVTAKGVSIERAGRPAGRDLELAVPVVAALGAKQWEFEWAPVTIGSAGRVLATVEARGSRAAGRRQPFVLSGKWSADLDAIESLPSLPALGWVAGRSASGEFTASAGEASEAEFKVTVVGHDPAHTVSATVNADEEPGGAGELLAPVKIAFGKEASDVSVEVTWAGAKSEPRAEVKLTSENVSLDHLRLLAAPLAAAGGVALPGGSASSGARWAQAGSRDSAPFWGDWVGRLAVSFDKLRTGDQDFTDVGGSFDVDHASVQLEGGHAELASKSMANLEGSILFDAGSESPYVLRGSASGLSNIDAAVLLPPQPGQDPMIEGHFTVAASLSGSGANLDELVAGTKEEFKLTAANGILRVLRTDVADAVPEAKEPVSDSLGDVGNFVGSVLGIKGHSIDPAKNKVSRNADTVINFTNQVSEIGYDKITVTAVRGQDRSIRLSDMEMTSPDVHIRGSGQIAYVRGLPISQEPLSVELQLGVRDVLAKLLSSVGLLSPRKDELGFSLLSEPVRLGGSLARVDDRQWHDLLAKAAAPKAPAAKTEAAKGGP